MRVLHVAASVADEWGGPATVVRNLSRAIQHLGVDCTVVATVGHRVGSGVTLDGVPTYLARTSPLGRAWTGHSLELGPALPGLVKGADLVHIHELWHYPHWAAHRAALRYDVPYIVTPHGELGAWHLRAKAWKKTPYLALVQRGILRHAAFIHAITEAEVDQIRCQVSTARIRVIPNGVDTDVFRDLPSRDALETEYPQLRQKKIVLFLGRLHKVKGLDLLASAFVAIARTRDDIALVVAGPDEGFRFVVERILSREGMIKRTVFTGMVTGERKLALLAAADVLVLPSYGEALGIVVLEAMACGTPVIISKQCKFPEVADARAGFVVSTDVGALVQALGQILGDPHAARAMGERGRQLVNEQYSWNAVAGQMLGLYREVVELKRGGSLTKRSTRSHIQAS